MRAWKIGQREKLPNFGISPRETGVHITKAEIFTVEISGATGARQTAVHRRRRMAAPVPVKGDRPGKIPGEGEAHRWKAKEHFLMRPAGGRTKEAGGPKADKKRRSACLCSCAGC